MKTLLKTNFRRYFRYPLFWTAVLFSVFLGISGGLGLLREFTNPKTTLAEPDKFLPLFLLYAQAAVLAVLISSQHRDGIFRNKVIAGNSKGRIFLAELLTGLTVSVLLYAAFAIPFSLAAHRALQANPLCNTLAGAGMLLPVFLTVAALNILICSQIRSRTRALILCMCGMFFLFAANYFSNYLLYMGEDMKITLKLTDDPNAPARTTDTYHHTVIYIHLPESAGYHWNEEDILVGKDGTPVHRDGTPLSEKESPERRVYEHPKYCGNPIRTILLIADTLNPLRPMNPAVSQFNCVNTNDTSDDIAEHYYEERDWRFALLPRYLPLQLGMLTLYCAGGWLLFRKKELN